MITFINALVLIIALLHIYFLVLEMFLWTTPRGLKVFRQTLETATSSKTLAANQGLYNGFLSAGLIWSLLHPNYDFAFQIKLFFLSFIAIAGIYGAITVTKKILYVQTIPAVITLGLLFFTQM